MSYLATITITIPRHERLTGVRRPFPTHMFASEFDFARVPNWDGRDARALTNKTVSDATALLTDVGADAPSEVAPGRTGSLAFVWENGKNYVYCDVGPDGRLHVHHSLDGQQPWEAVASVEDQELVDHLRDAMRAVRRGVRGTRSYGVPERHKTGYVLLANPR